MRTTPASQEFASTGATFSEVAFPAYNGPSAANGDQLRIRYDASANKYEVFDPQTSDWRQITPDPSVTPSGGQWKGGGVVLHINNDLNKTYADSLYNYSALVEWQRTDGLDRRGVTAFGVPSNSSAIPVSGSATFDGKIYGFSNETWDFADWGRGIASVSGDIQLKFDFAVGALSGSISPKVYASTQYALPTMTFIDTVYSSGSTNFSGRFDTPVTGANAFSGQFTGPQANELIGNFVFPYRSTIDGKDYEAGGGFIAKTQP